MRVFEIQFTGDVIVLFIKSASCDENLDHAANVIKGAKEQRSKGAKSQRSEDPAIASANVAGEQRVNGVLFGACPRLRNSNSKGAIDQTNNGGTAECFDRQALIIVLRSTEAKSQRSEDPAIASAMQREGKEAWFDLLALIQVIQLTNLEQLCIGGACPRLRNSNSKLSNRGGTE